MNTHDIEPMKYGGVRSDDYVTGWNDCYAAIEADRQANKALLHYMPETIAVLKATGCNESLVTDIEKAMRGKADRQARGEPAYWKITKPDGVIFFECYHAALENYKKYGFHVEPLYASPQPPQIPEGYALVPTEPTEEMLRAAYHAVESEAVITTVWLRKTVYKAMLEAAPEVKEQ